jgi:hypothetical protein
MLSPVYGHNLPEVVARHNLLSLWETLYNETVEGSSCGNPRLGKVSLS